MVKVQLLGRGGWALDMGAGVSTLRTRHDGRQRGRKRNGLGCKLKAGSPSTASF